MDVVHRHIPAPLQTATETVAKTPIFKFSGTPVKYSRNVQIKQ
jgi:hypothetical protein